MIKSKNLKILLIAVSVFALLTLSEFNADAASKRVYVTNAGNGTVSIIDTSSNKVVNTIRVGVWPAGITIDPAAKKAYIVKSNEGDSTVSVIDIDSNSIIASIKVGIGPMSMALNPGAGIGYAADTEHIVNGKNVKKNPLCY